jgi:predicted acylesterase/phospholipase RssA
MLTIHQATSEREAGKRPSIGLAIAGGGPVGAVYELGALRALEESIDGLELHELDIYVGVSAGAFLAASLANRISCVELCRIFMGLEHSEVRFVPEKFLRPAYREYLERAVRVPKIVIDALLHIAKNPARASVSELIGELGKAVPSGIFDNESIHHFLQESFESAGRGNSFDDLDCKLYVVAVDLDTGAAVRFGSDQNREVPISRAVQASAALPGLYPPVQIGERYFVDGALRRTLHASVALDQGVDLLLGINPLVPYDSSEADLHIATPRLISGGLPLILSQTFRALIQSRMKIGFEKYRSSHSGADLLLMEPDRGDETLFFTNIFSYASRNALAEHAYQATRADLLARATEIEPLLEPHGLSINLEKLRDESMTLPGSLERLASHTSVSRKLDRSLRDLETLLDKSA